MPLMPTNPILTTPLDPSSLSNQLLTEQSDFTGTVENSNLPAAIKRMIALSANDQGTNQSPSILLTIASIPGTSQAGSVSKAIECYGFYFAARHKSIVGENGQLQASGHVIVQDLVVICPDDAYVEPAIQNISNGTNVGNVSLFFLRNVGSTGQTDIQIDLTNARISTIYETESVTAMGFGFDTVKVTYFPVGDDAAAKGKVGSGFNLTTNAVVS